MINMEVIENQNVDEDFVEEGEEREEDSQETMVDRDHYLCF